MAANALRRTVDAFAHHSQLWRNTLPAAAPATQLAPAWVFLGPPGVGKGTYSSRVAEALGIPHISAGDLVRDEIKSGSRYGQQVCSAAQPGMLRSKSDVFRCSEWLMNVSMLAGHSTSWTGYEHGRHAAMTW